MTCHIYPSSDKQKDGESSRTFKLGEINPPLQWLKREDRHPPKNQVVLNFWQVNLGEIKTLLAFLHTWPMLTPLLVPMLDLHTFQELCVKLCLRRESVEMGGVRAGPRTPVPSSALEERHCVTKDCTQSCAVRFPTGTSVFPCN